MFINHYGGRENYFGYVAFDQNIAIGFMGLIFSEKLVNGKNEKFCNMTTWYVKNEYRGKGPGRALLIEVVKLKDYTITDLTPAGKIIPMLKKYGYKMLENHCKIILPIPNLGAILNKPPIEFNPGIIEQSLDAKNLKIYRDHLKFNCIHFIIKYGNKSCYIIVKKTKRRNILLAEIHYISDFGIFMKCISKIRFFICLRVKVFGLLIDERFLRGNKISWSITCGTNKYFLSNLLDKSHITDNLYTELLILNTQN